MEETGRSDQPQNRASLEEPHRIGGVLIFVAIGLVISLFQNFSSSSSSLRTAFDSSIWNGLTDPNSPAYHPYWKAVLLYGSVTAPAILLANAVLLWFLFGKKRLFPKLMVILIPSSFALMLIGYFLLGFIPAATESAEYAKHGREVIIKFIALHVWVPYFLLSKRVEKTFVR